MRRANIVSCIAILFLAGYIISQSILLEYTIDTAPGPGFLPLWTGVFLGLMAVIILFNSTIGAKGEPEKGPDFNKKSLSIILTVIGGSIGCMLITYVFGMLAAIGLLTGFLSRMLGYRNWKTNITLTLLTPVAFWIIFTLGLQVDLPTGFLGM